MSNIFKNIIKKSIKATLSIDGIRQAINFGSNQAINFGFDHFSRDNIMQRSFSWLETNFIEGDYLHFGIWTGTDFISSYKCSRPYKDSRYGSQRHFYAFDSFEGLPNPKDDFKGKYKRGKYCGSKMDFVKKMDEEKIPSSDYTITEGYYEDVLTEDFRSSIPIKKVAAVVLDCDLYESTTSALKFVEPYLQQGTLVFLAEYFNYGGDFNRGMAKAASDFLKKSEGKFRFNEWRPYGVSGLVFICQKDHEK